MTSSSKGFDILHCHAHYNLTKSEEYIKQEIFSGIENYRPLPPSQRNRNYYQPASCSSVKCNIAEGCMRNDLWRTMNSLSWTNDVFSWKLHVEKQKIWHAGRLKSYSADDYYQYLRLELNMSACGEAWAQSVLVFMPIPITGHFPIEIDAPWRYGNAIRMMGVGVSA